MGEAELVIRPYRGEDQEAVVTIFFSALVATTYRVHARGNRQNPSRICTS